MVFQGLLALDSGMTPERASTGLTRRRLLTAGTAVAAAGAATLAAPVPGFAAAAPTRRHASLLGRVQSGAGDGARALAGWRVSVLEVAGAAPRVVGHGTTGSDGSFGIRLRDVAPDALLHVRAEGAAVSLSALVRAGTATPVAVNELTTVATGYAAAQLIRSGRIRATALQRLIVGGMHDNLVDVATGAPSDVLTSSPNADQTISLRTLRSLGNLLAHAVRGGAGGHAELAALVPRRNRSRDLALVAAAIARDPGRAVEALFALSLREGVYAPALHRAPDAWVLAVKVNDTGSPDAAFGGPAHVAFDDRGCAWITNNVVQGTAVSSTFNVVLRHDGRPSDGTDGTPPSVLTGGGILGAGFGVARDPHDGTVWFGNFGWGGSDYQPSPATTGSLSAFDRHGTPISGPSGTQGGPDRAQGIAIDPLGHVWTASYGDDRLYVFPFGDPDRAVHAQLPHGARPFDVHLAADGSAWLTCSGGMQSSADSYLGRFVYDGVGVRTIWLQQFGHSLKGFDLDSLGNAWIASGGDSCVYLVDQSGEVLGAFSGGGVDTPWSVSVDGDDHVWVANFGPEAAGVDYDNASVSKLAGANPRTRPPGLAVGDPMSPPTGYTLPSAGEEVLLADGSPLYGAGAPPAFTPLQRLTSVRFDAAGNGWAMNNWKPRFDVDLVNPGGDGVVIFVGLGAPRG